MNGLDLFSGIGGISIALRDWVRPVAYCEIDPYCQGVLLSRMSDGRISHAPIWDNVTTLQGLPLCGHIDIIYGGFPCQDISVAGNGKGLAGERSGLFFEIVRLAKEIKPTFIFLENIPAITSRGGLSVIREVAKMGYDCRWCVISAASVGALHKRERWFLLAHSNCKGLEGFRKRTVSDEKKQFEYSFHGKSSESSWKWETEPSVGRMADGICNRVDRLKALGNAVVPVQAKEAFKILMGIKEYEVD